MNCQPGETATEIGCVPNNPVGFVQFFYNWGLGLIAVVALLFLMYGSYVLMTSKGNPEMVARGRSFFFYAIVGLLFAAFGIFIIRLITVDVLKVPGFN